VYAGIDPDDVKGLVGWPLRIRSEVERLRPPSKEELRLLREVLDPHHLYLQKQ